MENQPILYKAQATMTLENYLKMNRTFIKVRLRKIKIWYFIFLGLSVIQFLLGRKIEDFIFIIIIGLLPLLINTIQRFKGKHYYNQTKAIHNNDIEYFFYEDSLKGKQSKGEMLYDYSDLYRLIITENNLYLLVNNRQAMIIDKKTMDADLTNFLKGKSQLFNAKKDKVIEL
ncbi:YcxB family protein [Streptococcus iniae]|uniref:YcxB family protein n=1 Tax=Streptococcus iniae TaxID=1346 RepID=UPI0008DAAB14|nr:YcxB family protein [Streptococcus iniae]OHX26337.1 hypothetical protein BKX95_10940 [Streptococcus iniae]RLV28315.1 YcxB family protein [Streptococcus iniae]